MQPASLPQLQSRNCAKLQQTEKTRQQPQCWISRHANMHTYPSRIGLGWKKKKPLNYPTRCPIRANSISGRLDESVERRVVERNLQYGRRERKMMGTWLSWKKTSSMSGMTTYVAGIFIVQLPFLHVILTGALGPLDSIRVFAATNLTGWSQDTFLQASARQL